MTRLISSLCAAVVLSIGVVANAAPMATATINVTGATTFQLLLSANTDANFGVSNYLLPIAGASTFTHSTPRATLDPDGTGENNVTIGFSQFRSANNALNVQAGQSLDAAVPVAYGLGQQAGTLASLAPSGGSVTGAFAPYAAPLVIGTGTFAAGAPPTWNNQDGSAAVQLYSSTSGRGGPLTTVANLDLILATTGVGGDNPILTANPISGSTLAFGQVNNGSNPAPIPVALSNTGTGSINVTAATFSGPNASLFALSSPFVASALAGGAAATNYGVDFNVGGGNLPLGNYAATLTFATSSGDVVYNLTAAVPEPATLAMAGLAVVGLVGFARRK